MNREVKPSHFLLTDLSTWCCRKPNGFGTHCRTLIGDVACRRCLLVGQVHAERSKIVKRTAWLRSKMIVPNQVDMFPTERRDIGKGRFSDVLTSSAQCRKGFSQIDSIPGSDAAMRRWRQLARWI